MQIKLLDCTLRDGGYVNNWEFGEQAISDIKENLELSGADIIELGFIKNEPENKDRTVFNNMSDVKKIIGKNVPNRQYAVMAEVINPLPLDMLEPYKDGFPEIIRVIVWKRMLEEGFEYCKGIVEKGYRLCVQPARTNQYSDEEFINMIKKFNELNPMAFYVVDSWGTMYKNELLHYMKLADENLKEGISIGYHGHNNMMQTFDAAAAFCDQNTKRDVIIDASVYGIGRGAGNLNTEIFAKYLNENLGKYYNLIPLERIYDKHISQIYKKEPWGYSIPCLISAKYNCNPDYARYYVKKGYTNETIEKSIAAMEIEDRIIFKKELADKYYRQTDEFYGKTLGIVIITADKPGVIYYFLKRIADMTFEKNTDVIIYDGSINDDTKNVVKAFSSNEYCNIKYDYYREKQKDSIDKKVISAYEKYCNKYKYLWVTRDSLSINLDKVMSGINYYIQASYDLIVVDDKRRDYKNHGSKIYTDCRQLFYEQCHQMTVLGASIIRCDIIKNIIQEVPLDNEKNYGIWQPIAFFEYFATHRFVAASWVGELWELMPSILPKSRKGSSFWHENTLWQWGERWYKAITMLPDIYNEYKSLILKFELADCKPFSLDFLANVRRLGGLDISKVNKYKKYLKYVCNTPLWQFYLLSLIPKPLVKPAAKIIMKNFSRADRNIFYKKYIRRLNNKKICITRKIAGIKFKHTTYVQRGKYSLGRKKEILKKKKNKFNLNKRMAVIIVTANKADVIDDYLFALGECYKNAGIDCIIYDSSDNKHTKKVVEKWQRKLSKNHKFLFYEKYGNGQNSYSIDQKVIDACKKYADKYEYLWLQRDRLGILFNNCIQDLYNILNKKPDIIIVHDSFCKDTENAQICTNCRDLFKNYYMITTTLGQYIFKSSFVKGVIENVALDEKTYSLYFPTAIFHYIVNKEFLAITCAGKIFKYHPQAISASSHWYKFYLKQWVEFFYNNLANLPSVYEDLIPAMLEKWNKLYKLFSPAALLYLHKQCGLSKSEIKKYEKLIPFISPTPLFVFYEIAEMNLESKEYEEIQKIAKKYEKEIKEIKNNNTLGKISLLEFKESDLYVSNL